MRYDPATALRRFGLGARPGELAQIAGDPLGFVVQTLSDPKAALIDDPALAPSHVTFAAAMRAQRQQRLARMAEKAAAPGVEAAKDGAAPATMPGADAPKEEASPAMSGPSQGAITPTNPQPKLGQIRRDAFLEEASARLRHATATGTGMVERLVMFWSNHFSVSANKGPVRGIAGAYEREAIRPHVLGRFRDMLLAVEQHPAMLIYLDNHLSIGPDSRAGRNRGRGLNENLARESLELHTLGVGGGYTQADVTNLARILTGWTVGNLDNALAEPGKFFFAPARHEPGDIAVLGKTYADRGRLTGEEVLKDLARHRATARHIARKLAVHFVSDDPPPALCAKLEKTFLDTDGDLGAVANALVATPEAWQAAPAKILPPYDFLIALARGLEIAPKPGDLLRLSAQLGQPLWRPPQPAGWPDSDAVWAAPSSLRERLRIAEVAARQADHGIDPRQAADDLLGARMSAATRQAVARAETREQGLELLIMSPDFQRR